VKTKQNTSQFIMVVLTQDATQRQSVMETKDKNSVATDPRTGKSMDRPPQVYYTQATHLKTELSVKMITLSFGVKHGQLQSGKQPYTAAGYGSSFSKKSVLEGTYIYILGIVGNPVICVMCCQLSLGNIQCT
jgi:hypothetical protein